MKPQFKITTDNSTHSIRIYVDDTLIGFIQEIKFIANADKTMPEIEITFPDLSDFVSNSRDLIASHIRLLSQFPYIKIKLTKPIFNLDKNVLDKMHLDKSDIVNTEWEDMVNIKLENEKNEKINNFVKNRPYYEKKTKQSFIVFKQDLNTKIKKMSGDQYSNLCNDTKLLKKIINNKKLRKLLNKENSQLICEFYSILDRYNINDNFRENYFFIPMCDKIEILLSLLS